MDNVDIAISLDDCLQAFDTLVPQQFGRGEWPSDVAIQGWREAGLSVPCKVRFKLFTLDDERDGALPECDAEAVKRSLARFLAMNTDVALLAVASLRA